MRSPACSPDAYFLMYKQLVSSRTLWRGGSCSALLSSWVSSWGVWNDDMRLTWLASKETHVTLRLEIFIDKIFLEKGPPWTSSSSRWCIIWQPESMTNTGRITDHTHVRIHIMVCVVSSRRRNSRQYSIFLQTNDKWRNQNGCAWGSTVG